MIGKIADHFAIGVVLGAVLARNFYRLIAVDDEPQDRFVSFATILWTMFACWGLFQ